MQRTSLDLDAMSDFEARQDARDAKRRATAQAQGVTVCACTVCGEHRNLNWLGYGCNEGNEENICEGVYRAVLPVAVPA